MAKSARRTGFRLGHGLLAAALAASGCTTGGTTAPSESAPPPPAPTSFQTWTGMVRYSNVMTPGPTGFFNTYFEGSVTWQKETVPDPRDDDFRPPGSVRYRVASGLMHARAEGIRIFHDGYSCGDAGAADVVLGPNDAPSLFPDDPPRSKLDVLPDGRYSGILFKEAPVPLVRTCGEERFPSLGHLQMGFVFSGTLTSARMQGEKRETIGTDAPQTETATWDLTGR